MDRIKSIIALAVFFTALGIVVQFFADPIVEETKLAKETTEAGMDLLKLHEKYPDVIGWIKVEGTNIDYPVMRGEQYLYRNMKGEDDKSGALFVEEDWSARDRCTIIYGHNMWMYGTMFHELHRFEEESFFRKHRNIIFHAVCEEKTPHVEKRAFRTSHCILTDVSKWNYSPAQYITDDQEMERFLTDCDDRSLYGADPRTLPEKVIALSTCSYHIKGKNGRTLLVGRLVTQEASTGRSLLLPQKKTANKQNASP